MNRNILVTNSKIMSQLKNYLTKFVTDKTSETALTNEIHQLLQKIQPTLRGFNFWTNEEVKSEPPSTKKPPVEIKTIPKWKETQILAKKDSIVAQTNYVLNLLTTAVTNQSILQRLEDLNSHLQKHPDAKHIAEKANSLSLLLRMQRKNADEDVQGAINEALALLGYSRPVKGKGIRVLSIDGGGIRGILVIEMLKKLEELTGQRIREMFDLICGVSTGAIIASLLAKDHSLDEISDIYKNLSIQIFNQSAIKGTSNLVWTHSYYDTPLWEKLLQEQNGEGTLITTVRDPKCPKICIISAVLNKTSLSAYLFRNYTYPCHVHSKYEGSHKFQMWEAVRASAAAPTYFQEFKLANKLHQDGGILTNNPTALALHEAKLLWPHTPLQCVLSFGTGRTISLPVESENVVVSASSWKSKFYAVIESATDTEAVHTMLTDLLPDKIYYRFNPYLTEMVDMAEIDEEKLKQLERDAIMYLRRNEDKFQEAARVVGIGKGWGDQVVEWFGVQKGALGVKI